MIAMIGGLALGAAKTLVLSTMTEKMILMFTFMLLEWAADRTSNEIDNNLVAMMREQLQKTGVI